ncbi:MAG: UDP-N-acetylmuramoyl-tripeptide--D-alanyl-D-alanine ligase [Clostridia bacterium]|nr:UDP-N-acetylmuramoyl-tripeptide--D-alanyl-D-alanine ligase [Clostridia bacterium]
MLPLTFKEISEPLGNVRVPEGSFADVCTDTRKITPGCLFIALKGDRFDGHDFAAKALELGAAAVVAEKDCSLGDKQILVKSTRDALLKLAGYYRSLFDIPFIGITGSVGKTTTKEMIWTVMSSKYKTLKNEGNLNNEIGVPMTLFRLDKSYEAAVIEMGMSNFGEISRITAAVKPDAAVITNIGVSHIENLGSREGILKAKLEILESMKPGSPVILNGDDDILMKADCGTHPVIRYAIENSGCAYQALDITSTDAETVFTCGFDGGPVRVCLPFTGRHNIYNSLAAAAVGERFGVSPSQGFEALKNYRTTGMRQKIVKKYGITFIEDCYNASPDSQAAAMSVLGAMDCKRKIAVIGDMLELGDYSEKAHRDVGGYAAENGVDILFTYGERAKLCAAAAKERGVKDTRVFLDKAELTSELFAALEKGDCVLFKASRGMKLEEVIEGIYSRFEEEK